MTTAIAPPAHGFPPPTPVAPVLHSPVPAAGPRLRLLRHEPDPDPGDDARTTGPARRPAAQALPPPKDLHPTADLRRRVHQVLRLTLEVLDGRRPTTHLAAHLEPSALRYVRAARGSRPGVDPPIHLTSLHVSRPCAGAVEVAAVHRVGGRTRVLAARLEGRPDAPDRWRCSTLRLL